MKTARQLAVEALCHQETQGAWSNVVLNNTINKQAKLLPEDKSFASALFYGVLARRYSLDLLIQPLSKRPIAKLDLVVLNILRSSIYQVLYMDSVPDHSAVDEAVKLTRKMKKSSASGFVNAVLRAFLRTDKASYPTGLSFQYSCPPDLISSLIADYGEENTAKILAASLEIPPIFVRVNSAKTTTQNLLSVFERMNLTPKIVDLIPNCIQLPSSLGLYDTPEYNAGLFHIQDFSSQFAAMAMDAQPGERLLDCCAAPGGKSFVLAQESGDTGEVVACDLYPARVSEIEARNSRLGLANITTHALDMQVFHSFLGEFDRVICDAPCSGYGTIRRRPEIKYSPIAKQKTLPKLQFSLLNNAAKYCKKGGILVYSTCTLRKVENEAVVAEFLNKNDNFALTTTKYSLNNHGENTIFIGENHADGFFIATMIKK